MHIFREVKRRHVVYVLFNYKSPRVITFDKLENISNILFCTGKSITQIISSSYLYKRE